MTNGVTSLHVKSRASASSDDRPAPVEGRPSTVGGRTDAVVEGRWLSWGRSLFAVVVVLVLVALGIANIAMRAGWHEVEDGVLWGARPEGVTALEVSTGSVAALAGIAPGDILLAVNGAPVHTPAEVVEHQHQKPQGTRLAYTLLRLGEQRALEVSLASVSPRGSMYFVLAGVGLFTLLVGASVRLRRPRDQATLHFFWLCVAFFGAFTFSFNGPFDRLDWTFYWGDAIAMALLPPLLLHFTLVFPERPPWRARPRTDFVLPLVYVSALALSAGRIIAVARGAADGPALSRALDLLDRAEPLFLFLCSLGAVAVLARAFREITSLTGTTAAAMDCLGHVCSASVRSRSDTRCRGPLAPIRRSHCSSRRCRSASCRSPSHRRSSGTGCGTSK